MNSLIPALRSTFESAFNRFLSAQPNGEDWLLNGAAADRPAVELEDNKDEIHVSAELPGLKKEDFKVELFGDNLVIHGDKKSEREEKKKTYCYSERRYGSFWRSVRLPAKVNADKIISTYKDGVLDIHLPKTEKAKATTT